MVIIMLVMFFVGMVFGWAFTREHNRSIWTDYNHYQNRSASWRPKWRDRGREPINFTETESHE